jgi:hypothetical protein
MMKPAIAGDAFRYAALPRSVRKGSAFPFDPSTFERLRLMFRIYRRHSLKEGPDRAERQSLSAGNAAEPQNGKRQSSIIFGGSASILVVKLFPF